ncbi:hypothetical protein N8766_01595 [bacterium]|nr:hypothetical protein [bacterium]MDA7667749.1 hypothetical protein [bacterium]MDA7867360.1 hypothetical protein [Verrucomicrobiota bacterium]
MTIFKLPESNAFNKACDAPLEEYNPAIITFVSNTTRQASGTEIPYVVSVKCQRTTILIPGRVLRVASENGGYPKESTGQTGAVLARRLAAKSSNAVSGVRR